MADLKKVFEAARARRLSGRSTLLFVDEIHRFNKTQQDAFLPVMEDGTITLVGATTENPSFALNAALLSRARVLTFKSLDEAAILDLLARAEAAEGKPLPLTTDARAALARMADGDGRASLTLAEEIWRAARPGETLDEAGLQDIVQRRAPIYDKSEDGHYNLISALHKTVRGSDPDAALYYLCRMLDAGEDPRFLARRLVRMAVEDIGLADPQALIHARAAAETYEQLGSPEGELALANAVIYLATAPKSNAAYVAYKAAMRTAKEAGSLTPPRTILNAPTKLMKTEGYGAGYAYDHDAPDAFSGQDYWPKSSAASISTSPSTAVSSARSGSGWTGGRSSGKSGERKRAGSAYPLPPLILRRLRMRAGGVSSILISIPFAFPQVSFLWSPTALILSLSKDERP